MLKSFTLQNGLKVITYAIPQMRSINLSIAAKAGSFFDTKQTSGAAHFMEHLIVQGIPRLPNVQKFSEFIEGIAGSYNAATYTQHIKFVATFPANHLSDLLDITAEVFFEPLFPEDSIEKERNAILEEIKQRKDALWFKNSHFFSQVRYTKNHPLQLDGGGSEEAVAKLTKKNLTDYWANFFYPKNTYLTIVGGFDSAQIEEQINQVFSKYQSDKQFPGFPNYTYEQMSGRQVAIRSDKTLNTCYVDFSFPSISDEFSTNETLPQSVIKIILGNLRTSRLFKVLRQDKGLVYGVGCGSALYDKFGYFDISTQVDAQNLEEVIKIISEELARFIQTGPTKLELDVAKNYLINWYFMQFDHPGNVMSWIENELLWDDQIYMPEDLALMMQKITKKSLMVFLKKFWDLSKLNLTIQGPIENTKKNISKYETLISNL